jgi:multiple sugar transport system permease protein
MHLKKQFSHLGLHAILLVGAATCLLPFFWMISTSFKPRNTIFSVPPTWIPDPATIDNYNRLFTYIPFWRQFANTLLVCVVIVAGQVLFSSMGGYAFARLHFPGRDVIFLIYLATMMVPSAVTLIPTYVVIRHFGWVNELMGLIAPYVLGSAFATFLVRQFMMTIPTELEEAARIDGAGYFSIFFRIMLPLIRPALATLVIFAFVFFWNDFLWPLVVINTEQRKTLTVGIAGLAQSYYGTDYGTLMAGATLSVMPLIVLFFLAQREFIEGIALTGIKG